MTKINPVNDMEQTRQRRSLTESQKKNLDATQEGVIVNSCIKDENCNISEVYDTMVISDNAKLPDKIYENKSRKDKSLAPISLIATGVMATMVILTAIVKKSAAVNFDPNTNPLKKLPSLTRNLAVNEETHQAIYQMIQCPNQKTILAGAGVLAISAMAFMGKMFLDGFKDVWVKKREADIQKNLQENLIAVETQSFSGKIQIIRSMLADKAREFNEYLNKKPSIPSVFKSFDSHLNFTSDTKNPKENNLGYFALGTLTLGAVVGFGFFAMKNLRISKKSLDGYISAVQKRISEYVETSTDKSIVTDKIVLKDMLTKIDARASYAKEELSKLKWKNEEEKEKFIEQMVEECSRSTIKVNENIGGSGTPRPALYSHVNDYRAFFYNWLLETDNVLFRNIFIGITSVTAFSYGGSVLGEAIKEIQVKKMNAQTELELQKRLVSTELRNFKAKKDSAINPLTEEFYAQLKNGKPKEELKTIAENILYEVKNGPPFVYS